MFCFLWITGISRHVTLGGLPYFFSQQTSFKNFYIYSAPLNIQPYNCFYFILIWKNRARKKLRKTGWKHINFSHIWNEFLFQTRWNCNRTFHKWEHGRFKCVFSQKLTAIHGSGNCYRLLIKHEQYITNWKYHWVFEDSESMIKKKKSHIKSVCKYKEAFLNM